MQPQLNRTQDDAMVSYIFQRTHSDATDLSLQQQQQQQQQPPALAAPQQPPPHMQSQQGPAAVPLSHLQGKFQQLRWPLTSDQVPDFTRNEHHQLMYEAQLNGPTRMFHNAGPPPPPQLPQPPPPPPPPLAVMQQHLDMQHRSQIAPSAKKLWGVEEAKEDGPKGILNMNGGDIPCGSVWRDSTWSTSEHGVSQPLMVTRRSGSFPAGESAGSILSPRSSETGGLGVKMVEYVLGTSPTSKDLEPRMKGLVLNSNDAGNADLKKEKDKGPASPYDNLNAKKEQENGPNCASVLQQNGIVVMQNGGLDDDKAFNRTPGSRQPSPSDEELTKNMAVAAVTGGAGGAGVGGNNVVVVENLHAHHPHSLLNHHAVPLPIPPPHHHPQHHQLNQLESIGHQFTEQIINLEQNAFDAHQAAVNQQQLNHQLNHQPTGIDSSNVVSFDVQQLFRSQQQQQQQQAAAAAALSAAAAAAANTPAQLQLLQQQQYLQQQQLAAAAAGLAPTTFATAPPTPYIINPQEPYVIAGATVLPQYYGVPWGVYPANIIQQGATTNTQQRRPLTPSSAATETANNLAAAAAAATVQPSPYVIPAYYDQNGSIVMRGISNGPTMRLVSPAPVLVNPSNPGLQDVSLGLGLNSNTTGRRDSFDRNTSAFSPSVEYARPKWPQTHQPYSALGASVTACQSPLDLTSSSITPPPSIGTAGLQLGALMANNSSPSRNILPATAPSAEALSKFRSNYNLTANGTIFGAATTPTNSLFTKLGVRGSTPSLTGSAITLDNGKPVTGRSRLLEDFRNSRYPSLQLRDIQNHIVEFSQDQHGSRFIQQKLERASVAEKQLVFSEIVSAAYSLMTDVFGNYVIQKFFEFGTPEQKATLAQKVRGHVLPLALQMYGCRVIQKALESISGEQQVEIVKELDGHVLKCIKDQNGNHVVQKCIECVDPHALNFIISAFQGQVFSLSTHPYGCRVIQRILEHCLPEQTASILEELHQNTEQLIQDQYGNYVIQHVLEHGKQEDKSKLISSIKGKVLVLSQHKFASNVVEKCVTYATRAERSTLIDEVCGFNDNGLHIMMKDQYANYVVQKMLDVCESSQRKVLMNKIRPHFTSLRKYTYGKHIIAKLEKYFSKSPSTTVTDLGPIGPPTNGIL
ncbi:maternal protein pumilio isoform X3 [Planococcus citri]|uniref:maternal protein pumilio isoform X3 n=1 Tax=Planococcus citri TaxID=170843 RepID=UPI0031F9444F